MDTQTLLLHICLSPVTLGHISLDTSLDTLSNVSYCENTNTTLYMYNVLTLGNGYFINTYYIQTK